MSVLQRDKSGHRSDFARGRACGVCGPEHTAKVRKWGSGTKGWFTVSVPGAAEGTTKETELGWGGQSRSACDVLDPLAMRPTCRSADQRPPDLLREGSVETLGPGPRPSLQTDVSARGQGASPSA